MNTKFGVATVIKAGGIVPREPDVTDEDWALHITNLHNHGHNQLEHHRDEHGKQHIKIKNWKKPAG